MFNISIIYKRCQKFITKSNSIHNGKYDYSHVNYVNAKTAVEIKCPQHGSFFQSPDKHSHGKGCPKCGGTLRLTTEEFIKKAKILHGNKYDYSKSNYIKTTHLITIICPIHGEFNQIAKYHLSSCGCPKCDKSKKLTTEEFIKKAKILHGNKYDYSKSNYINSKKKVKIKCHYHGIFNQSPNAHLSGQECPSCNMMGKYSYHFFDINPNLKISKCILYLVEMNYNDEHFLKIGITRQNIKKRFATGYKGITINEIFTHQTSLFSAFEIENEILKTYSKYVFTPSVKFGGWRECFSYDAKDLILKQIMLDNKLKVKYDSP